MKKDLWIRLRDYHFDNLVPPHLTDRVVAVFGGVDAPTQTFASNSHESMAGLRGSRDTPFMSTRSSCTSACRAISR